MVPQRTICSQVSVTKRGGNAPASFENSLLCRSSLHSQQFITHFRRCSCKYRVFLSPGESKSMCREHLTGSMPSELVVLLYNQYVVVRYQLTEPKHKKGSMTLCQRTKTCMFFPNAMSNSLNMAFIQFCNIMLIRLVYVICGGNKHNGFC